MEHHEQMKLPQPQNETVACLGRTFASQSQRRAYFLERLKASIAEASLRSREGFPDSSDADILRLSDPPYYTACPNPFLSEFVEHVGTPYDPAVPYDQEPMAVDVSEGKTDPVYTSHAYHTKVPHKAIMRAILHYTEPGDVILDAFAGTGMTGVAAQACGSPEVGFRRTVEAEYAAAGMKPPRWGSRYAILNDLGPAATFIAANLNLPFDVAAFTREAWLLLRAVEAEIGWMYETRHSDGRPGRINYTVWSEVFACPECGGEVVFLEEALDSETQGVRKEFPCPSCRATLTKKRLHRLWETVIDPVLGSPVRHTRRRPIFINYSVGGSRYEKAPGEADLALLQRIAALPFPPDFPTDRMMHAPEDVQRWGDNWRAGTANFSHVHHLFLPRPTQAVALISRLVAKVADTRERNILLFFAEQVVWSISILNRYAPSHYSQVSRYMSGLIRVLSQHAECSPWYILEGKLERLSATFQSGYAGVGRAMVSTGSATDLGLPDNCIDYVFTDPPFGDNLAYAELNFILESFHRVFTNAEPEAVVNETQHKGLGDYQALMIRCFAEYHRMLKPGRWMTVVFHNSRNSVWNAIQQALQAVGFVVADVRVLDKRQGSFNQAVAVNSVKQDLVISAYKPSAEFEQRFELTAGTEAGVWEFVRSHLAKLSRFIPLKDRQAEVITERMNYMLFDRMVAYHLTKGSTVPLSAAEFYAGLSQRFDEREGMYFLPDQVAEYMNKRKTVEELRQLQFFVNNEASAIQWLRQQFQKKPQTAKELNPQFMKQLAGWEAHERPLELLQLLEQSFLCYDGTGAVPSQIHSYLSTNFKELRGLGKEDPRLVERARDRWYVPDPNRASDLEKLRERALLREFESYLDPKQKQLRLFRLEAVRAGFHKAWQERDYATILLVAAKLPHSVLSEDGKLMRWYDLARIRTGETT